MALLLLLPALEDALRGLERPVLRRVEQLALHRVGRRRNGLLRRRRLTFHSRLPDICLQSVEQRCDYLVITILKFHDSQ